jgi:hypothetical protein
MIRLRGALLEKRIASIGCFLLIRNAVAPSFEENGMKTKFLLTGILSLALVFGFFFTSCGGDDDDNPPPSVSGLTPPPVDKLPAIPTDDGNGGTIDAVTDTDDVDRLLSMISTSSIRNFIERAVQQAVDKFADPNNSGSYSFTNKFADYDNNSDAFTFTAERTSNSVLQISASELWTSSGSPTAGNSHLQSVQNVKKVKLLSNIPKSTIEIISGSTYGFERKSPVNVTISSDNKVTGSGSLTTVYAVGFTVTTTDNKAAKIILDAKKDISATFENIDLSDISTPDGISMNMVDESIDGVTKSSTYSGSLKVYGADNNTPVKTINITDEDTYDKALTFFQYY